MCNISNYRSFSVELFILPNMMRISERMKVFIYLSYIILYVLCTSMAGAHLALLDSWRVPDIHIRLPFCRFRPPLSQCSLISICFQESHPNPPDGKHLNLSLH